MLDKDIKAQLEQYLQLLEGDIVLKVSAGSDDVSKEMLELVDELSTMSSRINVEKTELKRTPSFSVNRPDEETGITFAGVPLGHEFTSLVMALVQVSGRPPKVEQSVIDRIKAIDEDYHFETYVSLSCNNCPVVVQALNIMSVVNPRISHTMIEGGAFKDEVDSKNIMGVPTVFLNNEEWGGGRMELEEILSALGSGPDSSEFEGKDPFDVLVVGGGPAGGSAAIYAARKGIRTGLLTDRVGGQVLDTNAIENFISVQETDGPKLSSNLHEHVGGYNVDVMNQVKAANIERKDNHIEVELENGAVLQSKTAILSTGARWRNIGVPGEQEFKNKGVAYCPHCDGPMFEGKDIAVIGGGNSGVEAAIDLAGVVKHVTVLEFSSASKADSVLLDRLHSLPNVTFITNAQTTEITGDETVNGLTYTDRVSGEERHLELEGVFVQIGLVPNTEWLDDSIERTKTGEIVVDKKGATNVPGIFAAGDCTDSAYKQIIISMGQGATSALGAFDYLIRNTAPAESEAVTS
ncbi:alkyl hydroperoxide reductase subunit F [Salimicrobium jeotgali]|uniref:NADH dehydrogenase n=1 Tax=Salimicrobium jeotgali TaxID=1230341 RepID=K2GPM4_9BACI|nr:alkyl hydroperoxide reductase subunit F [Salimicrobium jeotgali]AKG05267.1 alkyl hydroperoxide reductase subunit F [Salimicrobium jeotgali]EKE32344.1 alkyl hydroperoxide reductase subunit F [Salimicrobium jeotgali]MBM7695681.1 alkyl hydroperoxide reductase subunit F [Salimicrobium jeotgali]